MKKRWVIVVLEMHDIHLCSSKGGEACRTWIVFGCYGNTAVRLKVCKGRGLAGRRARAYGFVVARRKAASRMMIRKQGWKRQAAIEFEDTDKVSKKHKI